MGEAMSGEIAFNAMKVRAWHLASGEWLLLLFMHRDGDLVLVSEQTVPDEDAVKAVIEETRQRVGEAMDDAGFPGRVTVKAPGSADA